MGYGYKYNKGTKICNYTITNTLGKGGNGEVYEVKNRSNNKFAMKILTNKNDFKERYARFKDEIKIVREHQEQNDGILPIIDMNIPEIKDFGNGVPAWYTMPLAKPIREVINKKVSSSKEESIKMLLNFIELAKTIEYFHKAGIAHRDIKPENIYFYNDKWVLSDFGLVDYPKKDNITRNYLGPKATIAPEMRLNAKMADGKIADVYSLAKTLWILITNSKYAFDGVYNNDTKGIRLNDFIDFHIYLSPLEKLLENATQQEPNERIKINEFIEQLQDYIYDISNMSRVYTELDLQKELEDNKKNGIGDFVFHIQHNVLHEKKRVMEELFLHMYHNEKGFIKLGYDEEVRILKMITYKLSIEKKFIVSPIFRHTRNEAMLNIAVYINYSPEYVKKMCNLLCYKDKEKEDEIVIDIIGSISATTKYENDLHLNEIVDYIEKRSVAK
ncbi:protein kinase [Clostridium estertheticum]|uniref:protein kinase domain-containing protein n=1 Tax=Clostridium estertheticum TaxID=238834 RepID=UPI0013E99547|nr:protein kinase [Clostridium estertheticum]MBZ9689343.1 protein kinase [Clostridium estertheticum]